ncbi:hypothetical protein NJB1604_31520 [Mycobacterium marinum]|uniref:hypothetical protein n=1 Tax=Mycobacterium marinum TaxID=1781 RepID=UPI0021C47997|nr:hypothetical protein [Mycobacterium marinum]GJO48514.1 hypothetical protein NJB1604_31520 [Mycobacterium marinum]
MRESANPYELPGVYIPFDKRVLGSSTLSVFEYRLETGAPTTIGRAGAWRRYAFAPNRFPKM